MPENAGTAKWSAFVRIGIVFLVLAGIVLLAALNIGLVRDPALNVLKGKSTLEEGIQEISKRYLSDKFTGKEQAITLNGFFARLSARRVYNEVTLLSNGMLIGDISLTESYTHNETDLNRLVSLYHMVDNLGIPFLYVQRPNKLAEEENLLPAGTFKHNEEKMDRYHETLEAAGAHTLDMGPILSKTAADLEKYYYRTDHHWNSDGAFITYQHIMELMQEILGQPLDMTSADPDNWERHEKENWWIGSYGKRVGPLFAGMDSLIWMTPRFETGRISRACLQDNSFHSGDFTEACLRPRCYEKQGLFSMNNYYVYVGSDDALHQFRNLQAPNPQRVLLVKNSFAIPIMAFMATAFREVDALDPRDYDQSSLAQYIAWTKPDIVLLIGGPQILSHECVEADPDGSKQAEWAKAHPDTEEELFLESLTIEPEEKKKNNSVLLAELVPGNVYHLAMDRVAVDAGETDGISAGIWDAGKKKYINAAFFDIAYCNQTDGFRWSFAVPENEDENARYELWLYAGVAKETKGVGITASGIRLTADKGEE